MKARGGTSRRSRQAARAISYLVRSAPISGRGEAASPEDADWSGDQLTLVRVMQGEREQAIADENRPELFVDEEWPRKPNSIDDCLGTSKQRQEYGWNNVRWRRAWALVPPTEEAQLFATIEPADLLQGALGDCWLLSAIASLAEFPDFVRQMFTSPTLDPVGKYCVRLFDVIAMEWREVTIDDRIPCEAGEWFELPRPIFARTNGPELYTVLIEKAFAKFSGSYAKLKGGLPLRAWMAATGCTNVEVWKRAADNDSWILHEVELDSEGVDLGASWIAAYRQTDTVERAERMFALAKQYDEANYVLGASVSSHGRGEVKREDGLVEGHAYSLLQVVQVGGALQLLQLRNPWGNEQEWSGDWSDSSPLWEQHPEVKDALHFAPSADGLFWMSWDDFRNNFDSIEVCKRAMPGKRGDFATVEAAAATQSQGEAVDEEIERLSKVYPQLQDDPIDSIEHKSIKTRSLELIAKGKTLQEAVKEALIDEVLPELKEAAAATADTPPAEPAQSGMEAGVEDGEDALGEEQQDEYLTAEAEAAEYEMDQMGAVDNAAGATVGLARGGAWKGELNKNFDHHMEETMRATWAIGKALHKNARNVGERYSKIHCSPMAPRNGFYDQRYVCATLPMAEIDEEADFEFLLGSEEEGIKPPARVTFAMKGLQDLHVQWISNFLDEANPEHGQAIKSNREQGYGVRVLYLNDNNITDEGIMYLADALKTNSTLEELYLQYTAIGDKGLQHLLEMLAKNKTLRRLDCGRCGISGKGAQEVLKAFGPGGYAAGNQTLELLGLFGNEDEIEDDLPQIYELFPRGKSSRGKK